jgi:hypothetical protein
VAEEPEEVPSGAPPAPEPPAGEKPEAAIEPEPAPEPVPESEPEPEPVAPATPPVQVSDLKPEQGSGIVVITVDELAANFARDRAAANAKLAEKVLRLTGVVEKVFVKDHLDIFYIVLTSARGQTSWNVRCSFPREQGPLLNRLTVGELETVQGKYAGYEKNIILKDCALVR